MPNRMIDNFIAELSLGRKNTAKTQISLFKKWVLTRPGDELPQLISYWQGKGLAPNTIRMLVGLTNRWRKHQGYEEYPNARQLVGKVMRTRQRAKVKSLTKEQARDLMEACKDDPDLYTAAMISYHTGMRKGEVFGLKFSDINILEGKIIVERSYDGPTKNGQSRVVPISKDLEIHLLDKILENSHNYIGSKVIARQFDPNPMLQARCRRKALPIITFHGLRHTFATLALEAGRSPRLVQEVLGHTKLSTTLDLYWNLVQEELQLGFC
jgi:integrase